jgi:hypothetical protein
MVLDTTPPGISGLYQVVGAGDFHTGSSVGQENGNCDMIIAGVDLDSNIVCAI